MGQDFTVLHAAYCVANLPLGSALLASLNPALGWTVTDYRIHDLLCALAGQHVPFPWEKASNDSGLPEFKAVDIDDFRRWHESKIKKEVKDG